LICNSFLLDLIEPVYGAGHWLGPTPESLEAIDRKNPKKKNISVSDHKFLTR